MKNSKRILIVEDEEVIRALCRRILTRMGYEIVFASGAKEALEKIQGLEDLDLLVTDMRLPDGNGVEVMLRFREKHPRTKVLIITGAPSSEIRTGQLQEMGLSKGDILFKPFEMEELKSAIAERLEGR